MRRIWDFNPGVGGPVARNRVWFYASVRSNGSWNYVPGMVYNRNANNPNAWTYDPDPNAPVSNNNTWKEAQFRLTSQLTTRNKFAVTYQRNYKWKAHEIVLGGQEGLPITANDCVRIRKAPASVKLIRTGDKNYFDVLRAKLKWGEG